MFENLKQLITNDFEIKNDDRDLFNSIVNKPSFDYFNDKSVSAYDKASFLHIIQRCILYIRDKKNKVNYNLCLSLVESCIKNKTIKNLVQNLKDFRYVVLIETIILLGHAEIDILCDPNPYTTSPEFFESIVEYFPNSGRQLTENLKCLLCVTLLRYFKVSNAYLNGLVINDLDEKIIEKFHEKLMAPLVFVANLPFGDIQNKQQKLKRLKSCTNCFDVLGILHKSWLFYSTMLLNSDALRIVRHEIFCVCMIFISLFKGTSKDFYVRFIPLLSDSLKDNPDDFELLLKKFNIFKDDSFLQCKDEFFYLLSNVCCNKLVAEKIYSEENFVKNDLQLSFVDTLKTSLLEVMRSSISETVKSCFSLLRNFCKYLPEHILSGIIENICHTVLFDCEQGREIYAFLGFLMRFFENYTLSEYSIEIISLLSRYYYSEIAEYMHNAISNGILTKMRLTNVLDCSPNNLIAISKLCLNFVLASYRYQSDIPSDHKLPSFLIFQYFPTSIHKIMRNDSIRFEALHEMIQVAHHMAKFYKDKAVVMINDSTFCQSLISILTYVLKINYPNSTAETKLHRFDNYLVETNTQLTTSILAFIEELLIVQMYSYSDISFLSKTLLTDNSDMISKIVSVLNHQMFLDAASRFHALRFLDIISTISQRFRIPIDVIYSEKDYDGNQSVINNIRSVVDETLKTNGNSNDISTKQLVNLLEFLSSVLLTQTVFAFSFERVQDYVVKQLKDYQKISNEDLKYAILKYFSQLSRVCNLEKRFPNEKNDIKNVLLSIIKSSDASARGILAKAHAIRVFVSYEEGLTSGDLDDVIKGLVMCIPEPVQVHHTKVNVDMNIFVHHKLNPKYNDQYYYDTTYISKFLIGNPERSSFVDFADKLNKDLSMIDACAHVIQAIDAYSRTSKSSSNVVPDSQKILSFVVPYLINNLLPDSHSLVVLKLLSYSLTNCDNPCLFILDGSKIEAFTVYFTRTSLPQAFSTFANILTFSRVSENSQSYLLELFKVCYVYALKNNSVDALVCANEVALKMSRLDGWIEHFISPVTDFDGLSTSELMLEYRYFMEKNYRSTDSDAAIAFVDLLTIICANQQNCRLLIQRRFVDQLIEEKLPCTEDWNSSLWAAYFDLFRQLPENYGYRFLTSRHKFVKNFLLNESFEEQSKSLENYDISVIRVSITGLIAKVSPQLESFSVESPLIFSEYGSILLKVIEKASKSVVQNKIGDPYIQISSRFKRNEKANHLFILRNSLFAYVYMSNSKVEWTHDMKGGDVIQVIITSINSLSILFKDEVKDVIEGKIPNKPEVIQFCNLCVTTLICGLEFLSRISRGNSFRTNALTIRKLVDLIMEQLDIYKKELVDPGDLIYKEDLLREYSKKFK